jgi:hypothetical protein
MSKPVTRSKSITSPDSVPSIDVSSSPSLLSSSSVESSEDDDKVSSLTSEEPCPPLPSIEDQLLADKAMVDKQLSDLRVLILQQQVKECKAEVQKLLLLTQQNKAGLDSSAPPPAVPSTPARDTDTVRRALFDASSLLTTPSSATLARKKAIDRLPPAPSSSLPSTSTTSTPHLVRLRHTPPVKFTGEKDSQNENVERWIEEATTYLDLSGVDSSQWVPQVKGLLSGYALEWFKDKQQEVKLESKVMDWEYLETELILEFGRSTGILALEVEWIALRMGVGNADGTRVGGKSTYTVKGYTSQFTRLMHTLAPQHSLKTGDVLVLGRYLQGIKDGYPALYNEMKGNLSVLRYPSLAEAIAGAQIAESHLGIAKSQRAHFSSSSSSSSGQWQRSGGNRPSSTQVNSLEGETEDGEDDTSSSSSSRKEGQSPPFKPVRLNFIFRESANDGRYKLNETEMKMLYDDRRCYRCYKQHKFGKGQPKCEARLQTVAPRPLN